MQCTDDANEFCGAGNLNSVYVLPGAGVPKGCTASVCPASAVDYGDPTGRIPLDYSDSGDGVLYCLYVDEVNGVEDSCEYNSVSMNV
jgi:hypothetical protein